MNKLIIKIVLLSFAIIAFLASCDSDPTLQSYIVDSENKEGFSKITIPKSIIDIDESKLSPESQKAYKSIDKVNMLMLRKTDDNEAVFEKEKAQLSSILKGDQYKTLMSHNQDGMSAKFLYQGDKNSIDEIIVFGTMDHAGMGVARILGDDMNLSTMMKMMQEFEKLDIDPAGIKDMLKEAGINTDSNGEVDQDAVRAIMESKGIDTSDMEAFNKD